MKKMFLSFAILASACFIINATSAYVPDVTTEITIGIIQDGKFTDVKLESLNENVQKSISNYSETYTVKEIGYSEDNKLTKVVLESKADQSEKVIILDDEGNEVK